MVPMSIRVSPVSREFEEVEVMMQMKQRNSSSKEEYAPLIRRGICLSK